ncbi:hypothetical protein [Pelistega europaea]|uniref:Uncharacterized protein n=1 Tax=Pelistega europaea TaxID=106147 RepID=A0A7Y4LDB6_9BURK|nr:hypothetical protein [Pelistega europaea]NOL50141.1 hypothetical protein [Pelistega europaea]
MVRKRPFGSLRTMISPLRRRAPQTYQAQNRTQVRFCVMISPLRRRAPQTYQAQNRTQVRFCVMICPQLNK